MDSLIWLMLSGASLIILYLIYIYNKFIQLRVLVEEAWSGITIQLTRRTELLFNLVAIVKSYSKIEKELFTELAIARVESIQNLATSPKPETIEIFEQRLVKSVNKIFAVAEDYPKLLADNNYIKLQKELIDTEEKISAARRFYNDGVNSYNTSVEIFPNNLFAKLVGAKSKNFYKLSETINLNSQY